jgi:hypothetical protein
MGNWKGNGAGKIMHDKMGIQEGGRDCLGKNKPNSSIDYHRKDWALAEPY